MKISESKPCQELERHEKIQALHALPEAKDRLTVPKRQLAELTGQKDEASMHQNRAVLGPRSRLAGIAFYLQAAARCTQQRDSNATVCNQRC